MLYFNSPSPPLRLVTCFIALTVIMFSCEKEDISLGTQEGESARTEPVFLQVPSISLSDVDVTVQDGRLAFKDLMEYAKARQALSNSSSEEVLAWTDRLGHSSMSAAFSTWLGSIPEDKSSLDLIIPSFVHKIADDDFDVNSFSPINGIIANADGEYKIGSALHSVAHDHHITVLDGNESKLKAAQTALLSDSTSGVFVELYETVTTKEVDGLLKSSDRFVDCPVITNSRDDGKTINFEHTLERNTDRRRNMTTGFVLTTTVGQAPVPYAQGIQAVTYNAEMFVRNREKNGLIWRGTQPVVRIREVAGSEFNMIRTLKGLFQEPGCNSPECVPRVSSRRYDGAIPSSSFTTSGGKVLPAAEFSAYDFDSGIYIDTQDSRGRFFVRGMRYDFYTGGGRAQATWLDTDTGMDIKIGCK